MIDLPPPQTVLVAAGLGINFSRSRNDKTTISMFLRRHKIALAVGLAWFVPHIYLR